MKMSIRLMGRFTKVLMKDFSRFYRIPDYRTCTYLIMRQPLLRGTYHCGPSNGSHRCLSSVQVDIKKQVEMIGEKFKDSMELLEDAKSSFGTVYFSEDMKDAEALIEETLSDFHRLLTKLNEDQKREVRQTIQLKMNELQAQLQILKDSAKNTLN